MLKNIITASELRLPKRLLVIVLLLAASLQGSDPEAAADSIVICFTGDMTLAGHFQRHVGKRYDYPFRRIPWLAEADLTMVNLENPLTDQGIPVPKEFNFRAPPDYVQVLKEGGIDVVTLANNHIYDYAETGIFDTIEHLTRAGIKYVGAGRNLDEARRPVIIDVKGRRIAFLGYYGTRKHSNSHPATPDSAGTAMRNLSYIKEDIRRIRNAVEFIAVNLHWGHEKEHYPEPSQIDFAHTVIDYGADLVVGHHPHVLQGVEKYKNRVIAYSLGNFIFGGNSRTRDISAVLKITVPVDTSQQYDTRMIPVQIDYWQPFRLEGAAKQSVLDSLRTYSSIFQQTIF